jgi:serine/threonine protein kinase
VDLPTLYPAASPEALDLLRSMLLFSPSERADIDSSLSHAFVAAQRKPDMETTSLSPMQSDIETEGETGRNLLANVIREVMYHRERDQSR